MKKVFAALVPVSIRRAVLADAASLAAIKEAALGIGAQLVEDSIGTVYVADADGSSVGFLALQREAHPAVAAQQPLKLWQLYVIPEFHGRGVAARLMSAAIAHAREHRNDVIWLGVSEENARGIAFYRKQGFAPIGVHPVGGGEHAHQDIVMSRAVP
jgi:ribosomal protein S18 acetylase RimI-like enzyme